MNLERLKKYYTQSPMVLRTLYGKIPWSLRMGKTYRSTYKFLEHSLSWDKDKWEKYQKKQLKELLEYCKASIPFYSTLFKEIDIDLGNKNIWEEFNKIPFITKETITTNINQFLPTNRRNRFYTASTGGTTGKPMLTYYDTMSFAKEWAFKVFFWNYAIGFIPKNKRAVFRGVAFDDVIFVKNPIYNEIRFSPFYLEEPGIKIILKELQKYNPKFLHGYPSAIEQLAKYIDKSDLSINPLKGIILISENIYPQQKVLIEQVFKAPVYSFYGHSERLIFASMGKELDKYYAHPAYGITELIDDRGNIITENDILGEMIGTGFINRAMPLLRYKTGDYSSWSNGPDGLEMPALNEIVGRWAQEYLIGKNGKKISLTALNMHSDVYAMVRQMQYVQNTPGLVTLNIVKETGYSKKNEEYIIDEYKKKLGDQFQLKIQYVSQLKKTKAGKQKFLIQNLK